MAAGGLGVRAGGSVSWVVSPAGCGECGSSEAGWWQFRGLERTPGIVEDDPEPKRVVVLFSGHFREPVGSRSPLAPPPLCREACFLSGTVLALTGNRKVGSLNLLLAKETVGGFLLAGFPVPEKR